jgi:hypothetical protein
MPSPPTSHPLRQNGALPAGDAEAGTVLIAAIDPIVTKIDRYRRIARPPC